MDRGSDMPVKSLGRVNGGVPEAKYTRFGEKIRQAIPGPMQCSMACGGRNCKWENPSKWSDEDQAIKGVFSSWVLDDVVAMSRPSTEVIKKYDMIGQFKESNISSIINLQRPGEHASCGPPLHKESQFTYVPQTFMDNDIFFYNFGWKDYGVASLDTILDMVKVMAFALSEGRVAVHCHAGLGRTGVLIACYLVYAYRMDASSAINTVRKRRPNSIQTRGQIACIQEFAQFLKPLRIVFPQVVPHAERLTLVQFLHRQRHLLHGFESRDLRYTPKVVHVVCQRLVEIATTSSDADFFDMRGRCNTGPKPKSAKRKKGQLRRSNTISTIKETLPGAFVNEHLDSTDNLLDPMESQEIDAILSPRLSRRSDSAKSKASSSSKSLSGPGSPVISAHSMDNEKEEKSAETVESKTPIMVSSVKDSQHLVTPERADDDSSEKDSSKPQVLLVKQGSRSALLPAATIVSQTSPDININNNNQIVPSSTTTITSSTPNVKKDVEVTATAKSSDSPSKNESNTSEDDRIDKKTYSLPSPTPSDYEPPLPVSKEPSNETLRSSGEKPPPGNYRSSAGRSQRVLPTGMPTRSRAGSGKAKKISLFVDEVDPSKEKDDVKDNDENNGDAEKDEKSEDDAEKETASADEPSESVISTADDTNEQVPSTAEKESPIVAEHEDLDRELDEIIEMKDDGGPFLSDTESEQEEGKSNANDGLSLSMASRVSWSEQMNNGEEKTESTLKEGESTTYSESQKDISESKEDTTKTSLMYRGERGEQNTENISGLDPDKSDSNSEDATEEDQEKSDENRHEKEETDLALVLKEKEVRERPKSGKGKTKTLEKPHALPIRKLTQSLCDLRKYDDISRDDVTVSVADFTSGPLSPSSKSSSSEDVRTPTGSATKKRIKDPITVAMALAYKLTDNEWLWEKVYTRQVELNTREGAWSTVEQEVDAHLLSCLMWSWIEHLSKPVLSPEQVYQLVQQSRPNMENSSTATECPDPGLFEDALASLGKPISSTLRCVLRCLLSLPPLSFELEASVIRRVISAFTQSYLSEDEAQDSVDNKNIQQLVSLVQNYLVKTRARELKSKQTTAKEKLSRKESETSFKVKKTDNVGTENSECDSKNEQLAAEEESVNSRFLKDDSDSSSATSSVSELPPRIAVS